MRQSLAVLGHEEAVHVGTRDWGHGGRQGHGAEAIRHEALEGRTRVVREELAAEVIAHEGRLAHVLQHGKCAAEREQGAHECGLAFHAARRADRARPVVEEGRHPEIILG